MRCGLFLVFLSFGVSVSGQDKRVESRVHKVEKLLAKGKMYKARTQCDAMLGSEPVPRFYLYRAMANNRLAEHAKAEVDARAALRAGVDRNSSLLQLGIAEHGLGNEDSALVHLRELGAGKYATTAALHIAELLRLRGDMDGALSELEKARAGNALDEETQRAMYRIEGECRAMKGDTTGARNAFFEALRLSPNDPVVLNSRGWFLHAAHGRHPAAIADYDRAIKSNPNYSYAFNNRGWSYYILGDRKKALADIERARKRRPGNPYVYRNLGVIALAGGEQVKACGYFHAALERHFTELYGEEVQLLVEKNCGSIAAPAKPVVPATNAPDRPRTTDQQRSNAP